MMKAVVTAKDCQTCVKTLVRTAYNDLSDLITVGLTETAADFMTIGVPSGTCLRVKAEVWIAGYSEVICLTSLQRDCRTGVKAVVWAACYPVA